MMYDVSTILHFVLMGMLGGILYVLIWAKSIDDIVSFDSLRHIAISAIAGVIYMILHTEYGFQDSIMTIVAGYFGDDFIQALLERFMEKIKPKRTEKTE